MAALKAGIAAAEIPGVSPDCINLLEDTSRASATELMTADGLVDLLIPARRCGTDPRLRGERNGSLHPDRNRNLPCVC